MKAVPSKRFFKCLWLAAMTGILLVGITSVFAQPEERKPAPRRPSVILIIADDLGYGDLGCYGQKNIKTPNLDRLAAEGARFTSFYGGGAVGAQSRASILTGRNAAHLGGVGNLLPEDATTISQLFKSSGYHTSFVGQWGLNGHPEDKSFDRVAACLAEDEEFDHYPTSLWRFDTVLKYSGSETQFSDNENGQRGTYFPDVFTKAAMNFIANSKPVKFNQFRSYFLCLSYNVPHAKLDLVDNGMYGAQSWSNADKIRAAMISRLDADVGKILERLESTGQTNNVLIIFTSGNGPDTNVVDPKALNITGGLRGDKSGLYEGGIRVPMIVWCPARINPAVISAAWSACDILPTLADVAWEKPPKDIDGLSFWPAVLGQSRTNAHEFLYWEDSLTGARAVRMNDWKAVRPKAGAPWELYDLKNDSAERQNVADKNPTVLAKVEDYLKKVRP